MACPGNLRLPLSCLFFGTGMGRDHDDGNVAGLRLLLEVFDKLAAMFAGEQHIQLNEIG